jgi:Cu/Ag efflux pump CusA
MLQLLVERSLRHPGFVVAIACTVVLYGSFSTLSMRLDVFPDFVPPEVVIQTEAPGFAPEQVEALVTRPLEATLGGLGGMKALRSESIQGLSVVTVVFEDGAQVFTARQLLTERLTDAAGRGLAVQGRPGVLLTLSAQDGGNTLEVTRALEAALEESRPALERAGVQLLPRLHRPADFIEASFANIRLSLLLGAVLVVGVLLLLLRDFRTALISLAAVPLRVGERVRALCAHVR